MDIGLENINLYSSESIYITSIEEFYVQLIELNDLESQITSDIKLYNTLDSISSCIKKYGVTESINFMYGENFSSTVSMEAEVEEHKSSLLKRIIDSICKFIRKVVNFFKDTFNGRKRMIEKLKEIRDHADEYQLPITTIAGRINSVVVAKVTDWNVIAKDVADAQKKVTQSTPLERPKNILDYNELVEVVHKMHQKLYGNDPITISTPSALKDCCSAIISWLEKLNSITSIEVEDLDRYTGKFIKVEKDKDGIPTASLTAYDDVLSDPEYHKAFVRYVQVAAGKIDLSESLKCVRDLISKLKKKQ